MAKISILKSAHESLTFDCLVKSICLINERMSIQAAKAVNTSLTLRNWLIGRYISEFELHGEDRAGYGDSLFKELAGRLAQHSVSGCGFRQLYNYRTFYRIYPQISRTVSTKSKGIFFTSLNRGLKLRTASTKLAIAPEKLVDNLSYSHFELLFEIDDPLRRIFYEYECICGNWSVRELKRQVATLYYERLGLSKDKRKLAALISKKIEVNTPEHVVRDPYVFEFLKIKSREVMGESRLEDALLDCLQEFLLEMGRGFCFEARQKRIQIGGKVCFVDLVLYHRILKCHVLIELKIDEFKHEHIGQLNTYVSWYKKNVMAAGDSPPVGILLCTGKDQAFVEFALAGMNNKLFVSKYQLGLPDKEKMRKFIEEQLREVKG